MTDNKDQLKDQLELKPSELLSYEDPEDDYEGDVDVDGEEEGEGEGKDFSVQVDMSRSSLSPTSSGSYRCHLNVGWRLRQSRNYIEPMRNLYYGQPVVSTWYQNGRPSSREAPPFYRTAMVPVLMPAAPPGMPPPAYLAAGQRYLAPLAATGPRGPANWRSAPMRAALPLPVSPASRAVYEAAMAAANANGNATGTGQRPQMPFLKHRNAQIGEQKSSWRSYRRHPSPKSEATKPQIISNWRARPTQEPSNAAKSEDSAKEPKAAAVATPKKQPQQPKQPQKLPPNARRSEAGKTKPEQFPHLKPLHQGNQRGNSRVNQHGNQRGNQSQRQQFQTQRSANQKPAAGGARPETARNKSYVAERSQMPAGGKPVTARQPNANQRSEKKKTAVLAAKKSQPQQLGDRRTNKGNGGQEVAAVTKLVKQRRKDAQGFVMIGDGHKKLAQGDFLPGSSKGGEVCNPFDLLDNAEEIK